MCGRFFIDLSPSDILERFNIPGQESFFQNYNITPSQQIAAIRAGETGRELISLKWGLLPSWSKTDKSQYSMINARAETVHSKPAYRNAFRQRRCLIPASGFYEWQKTATGKQPWAIGMKDDAPFAMAGIWEHWQQGEQVIESCSIIVTESNDCIRPIHDRMPCIISADEYDQWLDKGNTQTDDLLPLLRSYPSEAMKAWPVSTRVNNPANNSPENIQAL
jgi:putative SOS response-associated peptidase YedK